MIGKDSDINFVLFHHWETLGNLPVDHPLPVGATEDVDMNGIVQEGGEIRELHKYHHTPVRGASLTLGDQFRCSSYSSDNSCNIRSSEGRSQLNADISSRCWLRQMTDSQQHSASSSSDNHHHSIWSLRPAPRLSSDVHSRGHSASPRPQIYHPQHRSPSPNFTAVRE